MKKMVVNNLDRLFDNSEVEINDNNAYNLNLFWYLYFKQ